MENSTNIYQLLGVIVPPLFTTIGTIVVSWLSHKNKKSIEKNTKITADTNEKVNEAAEKDIKLTTHVNSRLDELIIAVKKASHAEGVAEGVKNEQDRLAAKLISVTKTEEITQIWSYLRDRAIIELTSKEILDSNSSRIIAKNIREAYKEILPELKEWYKANKDFSEEKLFKVCYQEYGTQLLAKVCKVNDLYIGACVEIAIRLAKEED